MKSDRSPRYESDALFPIRTDVRIEKHIGNYTRNRWSRHVTVAT
jgi:hypothetical protein